MQDPDAPIPDHKVCKKCGVDKPLSEYPTRVDSRDGHRKECLNCTAEYTRSYRLQRKFPSASALEDDDVVLSALKAHGELASFGGEMERACVEAALKHGSIVDAAIELGLTPAQVRAHLSELRRRAAQRGYSPANDMTKSTPVGFSVKGVSTYYKIDPDTGESRPIGQWVKTKSEEEAAIAALLAAMAGISDAWQSMADPVPAPVHLDDDLLCIYPMGDPHLGMMAWGKETGDDFDLNIAERNLCGAVDQLVASAPPAKQALIINLGDFFHVDNMFGTTTAGTRVDTDTRWAKMLRVGIRAMRRCIDRALEKHETVRVICEIGNHDTHASVMLALCLEQYYEREPRVTIDDSPAKFHWLRFGTTLIGVTHGDAAKPNELPAVMACDRKEDWGETEHRFWYTGHVHHDSLKEYPGVIVETFRTLAPKDAWHAAKGYRSGQDMKCDVIHRVHGRIQRNTVGVRQVACA